MTTLKEFEAALREHGMHAALGILELLRKRDAAKRSISPARRVTGRKMTPELAREILKLHAATNMTQQEIAFKLGVNQGRVNEVIKRGKWLTADQNAPEAIARDKALRRLRADHGLSLAKVRAKRTGAGSRSQTAAPQPAKDSSDLFALID